MTLQGLEGEVMRRGDPGMVLARKQFAAHLPFAEPELLVRCASAADVARAVAALAGTRFALRSGGHCFADRSTDAPAVIDLSALDGVALDGDRATFGAGVTAGAAAAALAAHGRAIPTGGCPRVSVAGLVLAGGFGYSGRRLGFVADRVRAIDVVLADGQPRRVTAATEPELFWALRGGGANGPAAVTGVTIETAPALPGTALRGEWPLDRAAGLIARWQRWAPRADPALSVELTLWGPDDPDAPCTIRLHGAAAGLGEVDLRPLGPFAAAVAQAPLDAAALAGHLAGRLDHRGAPAWQPSLPYRDVGCQATRSQFLAAPAGADAIAALVARFEAGRSRGEAREVELIPWGGAYAHAPAPACIARRDAFALVRHTAMSGARSTPGMRAAARAWADASHATLPGEGAYAGYAERGRPDWEAAAYGPLLPRLTRARRRYDPAGVFAAGR